VPRVARAGPRPYPAGTIDGRMAITFDVDFVPPLDLAASLEPFRRHGDDRIDRWDGRRLLRTTLVGGRVVAWRGEPKGDLVAPQLSVTTDADLTAGDAGDLTTAIRGTFVVAPASWADLLARDPIVADLDRRHPGLRPFLVPDLFAGLVRGISAQQVNLRWAATTRGRLAEAFGDRHEVGGEPVYSLDPGRLAAASVDVIRALQFTTSKARFIVEVADAIASGRIRPAQLAVAPDDVVITQLIALHGIGLWSAEWTLARTFGRPRVVAGDLGVRKAVARAYLGRDIASEAEVRQAAAHWGASAAVAQTLLLRTLVP
jgi:DNA-3-methyladenine glycosylase II